MQMSVPSTAAVTSMRHNTQELYMSPSFRVGSDTDVYRLLAKHPSGGVIVGGVSIFTESSADAMGNAPMLAQVPSVAAGSHVVHSLALRNGSFAKTSDGPVVIVAAGGSPTDTMCVVL